MKEGDISDLSNGSDRTWSEQDWKNLLEKLIKNGLVDWHCVTTLVLGQLNPPQVGTSLASNKNFQERYGKGKTWQAVREWLYSQDGVCIDCKSGVDLQADHVEPRKEYGKTADRLDNLVLRCRRCNVIRRPSHKKGGLTFQSAEQALMWILFEYAPDTYEEYKKMCRKYGLTMADIRFQEAWAMALWLKKRGLYPLKD